MLHLWQLSDIGVPFKFQLGLHSGNLLRFAISESGLSFINGRLDKADLCYLGKSNRARAFADSYSKVASTLYTLVFLDPLHTLYVLCNDERGIEC